MAILQRSRNVPESLSLCIHNLATASCYNDIVSKDIRLQVTVGAADFMHVFQDQDPTVLLCPYFAGQP